MPGFGQLDGFELHLKRAPKFGPEDRVRLTEYLDGMRDVERRIEMAERQSGRELPPMESPTGIPAAFPDHLKLMYDLQVIAFQTDMTRMITFMTGPEQSNRTYREIGIPDVHHSLSHHQSDPEKLEKLARIDAYHLQLLTYYLDKLRATPDQDGRSLFDNMIIMYGSSISDGNSHSLESLPILLLGGGAGGRGRAACGGLVPAPLPPAREGGLHPGPERARDLFRRLRRARGELFVDIEKSKSPSGKDLKKRVRES